MNSEPHTNSAMESILSYYSAGMNNVRGRDLTGQLTDEFQARLKDAHASVSRDDCHFYHTLEFPDGSVIDGGWDLRGKEEAYIGHVDFNDLTVLEFGPATGHLSFHMERQGAKVTILDVAPNAVQDLVPLPGVDLEAHRKSGTAFATEVRNSWWYAHRQYQSSAKAVYGDIYDLPSDLAHHDVSIFCSILLHLANPWQALRQAAAVTDKAMIVTDMVPPLLYGGESASLMEFNPGDEAENLVNWWGLSPGVIKKMLRILGFPHADIHYSEVGFHKDDDPEAEIVKRFMFTIVAERSKGAIARKPTTKADEDEDRRVRALIPIVGIEQMQHYAELVRTLGEMQNSLSWRITEPIRKLRAILKRK